MESGNSLVVDTFKKNSVCAIWKHRHVFDISEPRSKNDPTTAAEQTLAAAQKSQYFTSGLTQRCEILHSVA